MKYINKTGVFSLLLAVIVVLGIFACQQKKMKTYVIGIINPHAEARESGKGFIARMEELGYVEGKNVSYIKHESKENVEKALNEMVEKNVDLIFTYTTPASRKAKEIAAGDSIPVVFIVFDAVRSKLVNSMSRPGEYLSGVQLRGSVAKSMEWMLEISPGVKKVFVPIVYDTSAANLTLIDLEEFALKFDIELEVAESTTTEEFFASLKNMPEDIDAIFVPHSIIVEENLKSIIDKAIERKVPIASSGHEHYSIGALVYYGPEDTVVGRQAARIADKFLSGVSSVPVEYSEYFLGINLVTAEKSGIEIPETVLRQADFIIR